jgi:hypothetical protein
MKPLLNHLPEIIFMSLVFMWLMPYGTFDPTQMGFYLSILLAVFISLVTRFLLKRFRTK